MSGKTLNIPYILLNYSIRARINDSLYLPVAQDLKKQLKAIAEQNCRLLGVSHLSFSYKGVVFYTEHTLPPRYSPRLHSSLYGAMSEYLHESGQINAYEKPIVLGGINHLLNSTNNIEDVLVVLPSSLHSDLEVCSRDTTKARLNQKKLEKLKETLKPAITLMKERMALNLLY